MATKGHKKIRIDELEEKCPLFPNPSLKFCLLECDGIWCNNVTHIWCPNINDEPEWVKRYWDQIPKEWRKV